MEQGEYFDANGQQVKEGDLSAHARSLLADYRMVQYDLSVGHRYSAKELFYPLPSTP